MANDVHGRKLTLSDADAAGAAHLAAARDAGLKAEAEGAEAAGATAEVDARVLVAPSVTVVDISPVVT